MVSLIVAYDEHKAIGYQHGIPWHLPEDLRHFRKLTLQQNILMGRNTFETLKRPLPNRHTYVLTHDDTYRCSHDCVSVIHDMKAILQMYKNSEDVLYICGGALIYQQALAYVDEMWISLIDGIHEADTFFPAYDVAAFQLLNEERTIGFTIQHYVHL